MFFKKGGKKIDKLITSVLIGGALASIFGLSKNRKSKKENKPKNFIGEIKEEIGNTLVKFLNIFNKKK